MRIVLLLASAPVSAKNTLLKPAGVRPTMCSAALPRTRLAVVDAMATRVSNYAFVAASIRGCRQPVLAFTNWLLKSSQVFPS